MLLLLAIAINIIGEKNDYSSANIHVTLSQSESRQMKRCQTGSIFQFLNRNQRNLTASGSKCISQT